MISKIIVTGVKEGLGYQNGHHTPPAKSRGVKDRHYIYDEMVFDHNISHDDEYGYVRHIAEEDELVLKRESLRPAPHIDAESSGAYQHGANILATSSKGIVDIRI